MAALEAVAAAAGPLADALDRGRAELDARVATARRGAPGLDVGELVTALRGFEGIVAAVHALDPAAVDAVVSALFDAAVRLVPRGSLGPRARAPDVDAAWRGLLERAPRLLCADPPRVVAATFNALTYVVDTPGARPAAWIAAMASLSAIAADVDAWLQAGQVAAWRAGVAHARRGALDLCAALPANLGAVALDLDAATPPDAMARVLERLRADPWTWPAYVVSGEEPPLGLKVVCYLGAFRGWPGGRFLTPPLVGVRDGRFVVSDRDRAFELHADFFGATLVVAGPAITAPHAHGRLTLGGGGQVAWEDQRRTLAGLADVSSWASDDTTLVATRAISHQLAVIALSRYGR